VRKLIGISGNSHHQGDDVLEVETNWGLRKHGLAYLILEPFW